MERSGAIGTHMYAHDYDRFPPDTRYQYGRPDVAWRVYGWEIESAPDTVWSGLYRRTGNVLATMVGDDRPYVVDPADLRSIAPDSYCRECGQIGCGHGR